MTELYVEVCVLVTLCGADENVWFVAVWALLLKLPTLVSSSRGGFRQVWVVFLEP